MSESSVERRKGEQQGNRTMKCIILVGVSLPLTGPHFTYNDYFKTRVFGKNNVPMGTFLQNYIRFVS